MATLERRSYKGTAGQSLAHMTFTCKQTAEIRIAWSGLGLSAQVHPTRWANELSGNSVKSLPGQQVSPLTGTKVSPPPQAMGGSLRSHSTVPLSNVFSSARMGAVPVSVAE